MKEVKQNICMFMCTMTSQCDFECDDFDDEYLYSMATEKEFTDSQFPFCVRRMKQHQDEDALIQKMIKKTNTNWYNIKEVEKELLVHNKNRICYQCLWETKFYNGITYCRYILGRKEWKRLYFLSILEKVLRLMWKRFSKHCHVCQMSNNSGRKKFGLVPQKKKRITKWCWVESTLIYWIQR